MLMILTEPAPVADHVPAPNQRQTAAVYTVHDVAARLRCSQRHVRDLIDRGDLTAVREGSRWLVLPAGLDAYLAGLRTVKHATPKPLPIRIARDRRKTKAGSA